MTPVNMIAIMFFLVAFIYITITYTYPYMQKNTSNPVLYTFLSFVALLIITYLTRGHMLLRVILVDSIFGPMFR